MSLSLGKKAPNFSLPAVQDGELGEVELYEELKKGSEDGIVLAFFPLAFSSVCTEELCQFRDSMSEFKDLNARVFGISVDSPHALRAFAKENNLGFTLLSDFNKETIEDYDVVHEELSGLKRVAKRSVFVLDENGRVKYRWVSDDPGKLPDREEIDKALGEIQAE